MDRDVHALGPVAAKGLAISGMQLALRKNQERTGSGYLTCSLSGFRERHLSRTTDWEAHHCVTQKLLSVAPQVIQKGGRFCDTRSFDSQLVVDNGLERQPDVRSDPGGKPHGPGQRPHHAERLRFDFTARD